MNNKKRIHKNVGVDPVYYVAVAAMALLFFVFHTIPFLKGIFYSFTDWKGYGEWNFVGLRNYTYMFTDPDIRNSYFFTFKFALITTILVNIITKVIKCIQ